MIVSNNAVFLHIPKTGGIWVRRAIESDENAKLARAGSADADHRLSIPTELLDRKVFVFVRNPWAWHVSLYNYLSEGSHLLGAFSTREPSFEEFLFNITHPTTEFKKKMLVVDKLEMMMKLKFANKQSLVAEQISGNHTYELFNMWQESAEGMFQLAVDVYTAKAHQVGKTETLAYDLKCMLQSVGDLTDTVANKIDALAPVNTGRLVDYRTFYTHEMQQWVATSANRMIEQYQYKF
jgi:hypothetical protein